MSDAGGLLWRKSGRHHSYTKERLKMSDGGGLFWIKSGRYHSYMKERSKMSDAGGLLGRISVNGIKMEHRKKIYLGIFGLWGRIGAGQRIGL